MDCMAWGDAEFEYGSPFLGTSLTWYLGRMNTFICLAQLFGSNHDLGGSPILCASWYMQVLLRLMELDFASLCPQKGLELRGHHWQADAVLTVLPRVGDERKPAEDVDVPFMIAPKPRGVVMAY